MCCPQASLEEMIAPGALVILTPIVVGVLFGTRTLSGVLAGSLVSGVQMAVSMSNTGGAWDNASASSPAFRWPLSCPLTGCHFATFPHPTPPLRAGTGLRTRALKLPCLAACAFHEISMLSFRLHPSLCH